MPSITALVALCMQSEQGRLIDTSYKQNRPAKVRLGINGLVPGCEKGIKSMRVGGKRRIVVPPEEGPPVGPSTFFSAKQWYAFKKFTASYSSHGLFFFLLHAL